MNMSNNLSTRDETVSGYPAHILLRMAHIKVLNDRRTYAIGATLLVGESEVVDDVPTACTDGINKYYGAGFLAELTLKQTTYLVLHECLHVLKMDLMRHKDLIEEDAQLFNAAADYVVNGIIESLGADDLIEQPPGALVDAKFDGWDVRQVYEFLRKGKQQQQQQQQQGGQSGGQSGGQGNGQDGESGVTVDGEFYSTETMDEHVESKATPADMQEVAEQIKAAVIQAGLMAGVNGGSLPQAIKNAAAPEIDWRQELDDFVQVAMLGDDDITFRKYDRRYVTEEIYYPTTYTERVGELVIAMDTSGSTYGPVLDEFTSAMYRLLDTVRPERVRIIHWDYVVQGVDVLTEQDYLDEAAFTKALKPKGGGGTRVGAVSKYIEEYRIEADCCVVFTDGYVESDPQWTVRMPTLWLVTRCETFVPPGGGRMVKVRAK